MGTYLGKLIVRVCLILVFAFAESGIVLVNQGMMADRSSAGVAG